MRTGIDERRRVLAGWLTGGGSICPFARSAMIFFATEGRFAEAVDAFALTSRANGQNAVVIVGGDDPPFEEARAWAHRVFLRVYAHCLRRAGAVGDEFHRLMGDVRAALTPESPLCPFLAVQASPGKVTPAFVVGMGPQYREDDPRYAPVTCLVVTWMHEVASAPAKVREIIHAEMAARTGSVYGADVIWRDFDVSPKPTSTP